MRAHVYICDDPVHNMVLESFYAGIPVEKELRSVIDYKPADVSVVFGVRKKAVPKSNYRGYVISRTKQDGGKVVVLETGYVNRGDGAFNHYAAGFDGLNGRADFRNSGMPDDRWRKLGVKLKPGRWHPNKRGTAGDVILCGQVPWDASVQHINMENWLGLVAESIKIQSDRRIIYRPHPKARVPDAVRDCETSDRTLEEDLARAWCVFTFNSNTAVDAVISGIPAIACDEGSMAWDVTGRLNDVETPCTPDRGRWMRDLCYTQWTPEEMRAGETWKHLFR